MKTLFKNARIIDRHNDQYLDILVCDGKIEQIGTGFEKYDHCEDLNGYILMPGFVDLHCHFRDPGYTHKEDLFTGSMSALSGGYTAVNLMGNTNPCCSTKEVYLDIMNRAEKLALIDIRQVMNVTVNLKGEKLISSEDIPSSVSFLSDDGKGILSNKLMWEAMLLAKSKNLSLMVHAEDSALSPLDYRLAEDVITIRDVYLSGKTGCRTHFSHVSTYDSAEAIINGIKKGYPVSFEVTPHHIYLSECDYKVNPPIRSKKDVAFLINAIKEGLVSAIATDHAPHTQEDKDKGAPGMIGLETAFYICYKVLVENKILTLSELSNMMSYQPARMLDLNQGLIAPGYDADFVVIDLNQKTTMTEDYFQSKSCNTPFLNETFSTKIMRTYYKGDLKFERR